MRELAGYGVLVLGSIVLGIYLKRKGRGQFRFYLRGAALLGTVCFAVAIWEQWEEGTKDQLEVLKRNEAGLGSQEIRLSLDAESLLQEYPYPITVEEQQLTKEEIKSLFIEAEKELERLILGKNLSLDEISSDLYLPAGLMDGKVAASYYFDPYEMVTSDGKILWDQVREEKMLVKVTAELNCQGQQASHEFYICLTPKKAKEERMLQEVGQMILSENQKQGQKYLQLPQEYEGTPLHWKQEPERSSLKLLLVGIAGMVFWYVYQKEKREREKKAWNQQLALDYPDIVSQISLLTGAGMTVSAAWGKMTAEYCRQRKEGTLALRPGYEEMQKTWYEMQDGIGEQQAYENFGIRCMQSQYRKLASILMQNVRKGTKGMQQLLDAEAKEAFLQRKLYAKQMGEEAGTKLLIPMGIMLLLVFAILMIPAMINLQL